MVARPAPPVTRRCARGPVRLYRRVMRWRGTVARVWACAALVLAGARADAGFLAPYDDVLVSAPEGTYFLARREKGLAILPGGADRLGPVRRSGLVRFPMPLSGAVVGDFAGDAMDDILLTQAPGGPYLLVNQGGYFAFEHRTIQDRESPRNLGSTRLAGLRGRRGVTLPLPFADALSGDFVGDSRDDLLLPHAAGGPLLLECKGDRFEPAPLLFEGGPLRYALEFEPFRKNGEAAGAPYPLAHALAGDFAGDGRADLILLAAEGGPRLLVRKEGKFVVEGGDLRKTRLAAATRAGVGVRDLLANAVAGNFAGDRRDDLLVLTAERAFLLVTEGASLRVSEEKSLTAPAADALRRRLAVAGEFVLALD